MRRAKKDYNLIKLQKRKIFSRRTKLKIAKKIRKFSIIIISIFLALFIIIFFSTKFKLKKVQKIISIINNNPINQNKFLIKNNNTRNQNIYLINNNSITSNQNNYLINSNNISFNYSQGNNPSICNNLDPIFMLGERLNTAPIQICENQLTKHICYSTTNVKNIHGMAIKNGIICTIENFVIDPSKWIKQNINNTKNRGAPLLSKGFYFFIKSK